MIFDIGNENESSQTCSMTFIRLAKSSNSEYAPPESSDVPIDGYIPRAVIQSLRRFARSCAMNATFGRVTRPA